MKISTYFFCALIMLSMFALSCKHKSPEQLPKFKQKFRAQIVDFEKQKEKADERVAEGVSTLNGLQEALQNAKDVDKEFNVVYTRWEKVNKQVEDLNKEYEGLKQSAENLFNAMETQTASLNDAKTKNELNAALAKTRTDYQTTLNKTSIAIGKLRSLHTDAVDVVKALEVAVALGQIAQINDGLKSIEDKVGAIMTELNATVAESKELYESRIGTF